MAIRDLRVFVFLFGARHGTLYIFPLVVFPHLIILCTAYGQIFMAKELCLSPSAVQQISCVYQNHPSFVRFPRGAAESLLSQPINYFRVEGKCSGFHRKNLLHPLPFLSAAAKGFFFSVSQREQAFMNPFQSARQYHKIRLQPKGLIMSSELVKFCHPSVEEGRLIIIGNMKMSRTGTFRFQAGERF